MPKLVLRVGPEAAKMPSTEGFARYAGPTPPAGAYPAKVKQITIKESKQGNPMFMVEAGEIYRVLPWRLG